MDDGSSGTKAGGTVLPTSAPSNSTLKQIPKAKCNASEAPITQKKLTKKETKSITSDNEEDTEKDFKEWYYLVRRPKNQNIPDQDVGPFSLNDISNLLAEGALTLKHKMKKNDEEYKDMSKWDELSEIVNFRRLANKERWFFEDAYRKIQGPISIGELLFNYREGLLFEKTLVRKKGKAGWKTIEDSEKEGLFAGIDLDEYLDIDKWYYLDTMTKDEQGPLPAKEILIRFNTNKFTKSTMIRREEMEECRELGTLIDLLEAGKERAEENENKPVDELDKFYYEDKYRKIHGPVPFQTVLDLLHEKELSLESKVKKDNMAEWMVLADAKLFFQTSKNKRRERRRKRKKKQKWKNVKTKNNLYVQNLPANVTIEWMEKQFKCCGIIKKGPDGKPRIKLYKETDGLLKGDGLVTFLQAESVELALKLIDGKEVDGKIIKCSVAEFACKGDYQPNKRRKLTDREKRVMRQLNNAAQSQLLSWDDDENKLAPKLKIVIVYHIFTLEEVAASGNERLFYDNLADEIGREFQRVGGKIEKMTIFEGNCDGVVAVKYKENIGARRCLEVMNGRYFATRRLKAEYWDGKTNFKVQDMEDDEERLKRFAETLIQNGK